MHAASPVRIDLAPDRAAAWGVRLLAIAAAANTAAWLAALGPWRGWWLAAAAGAAAVVALALGLRVARDGFGCAGLLTWDGEAWAWIEPGAAASAVHPQPMLDIGSGLLLRLRPLAAGEPVRWGVARSARARGDWAAWRAALQAAPGRAPARARTSA